MKPKAKFQAPSVLLNIVSRTPKQLGEAIKRVRKGQHLSQEQLAKKIGSTQRVISSIESGKAGTYIETIMRVISALNYEIELRPKQREEDFDPEEFFG